MNETKHTPGPWKFDERIRMAQIYAGPERNCLANGLPKVATWNHALSDQERADARLIAAAPELLEALAEMTAFIEQNYDHNESAMVYSDKARAAIAKAEGRA